MRFNLKYIFVFGLFCFGVYHWMERRPIAHPPGILVEAAPVQEPMTHIKPFAFKDYTITPVVRFKIKALVLSSEGYSWDRESQLAPMDLALGWGPMSDPTVLKKLYISQGNRWYRYSYRLPPPIPKSEIIAHSANMHLIPSTQEIQNKIKRVRTGEVVQFRGYLVIELFFPNFKSPSDAMDAGGRFKVLFNRRKLNNIEAKDGWHWYSSLSRTDDNNKSCELVWVEEFNVAGED